MQHETGASSCACEARASFEVPLATPASCRQKRLQIFHDGLAMVNFQKTELPPSWQKVDDVKSGQATRRGVEMKVVNEEQLWKQI
jgi:hypothetical protein